MKPEDFKEVSQVMDQNSVERKRALQTTKRKKFNYLKYHRETPTQQRAGTTENADTRHENNKQYFRRRDNYNQNERRRDNGNHDPYSNNRRENNYQNDRRHEPHADNRWENNNQYDTRNNNHQNQNLGHRTDNRTQNEHRSSERNAWHLPIPNARQDENSAEPQRKESGHSFLRRTNSRNNLSRKSSWNNIQHDRNHNEREDQRIDAKNKEIQHLQERIAALETNKSRDTQPPKNGATPMGGQKTGQPNAERVLNFISNTMNTLEEFKKHFTPQQHTNKTQ